MKRFVLFATLTFGAVTSLLAQFQSEDEREPISVSGLVIDSETRQPIEEAKVKYESLPYGSKIGVFTGSSFNFSLEDGNDYMLVVRADGYALYSSTVSVNENVGGKIERTIELTPNGVNRLIRLEKLIFALGKSEISKESFSELNDLVKMLEESETMTIQLEGHTDFRGNAKQNMKLSEDRVEAVREYLVDQGIAKNRIKTKAFGGSEPLSKASDAASRASNRRVEVRILTN